MLSVDRLCVTLSSVTLYPSQMALIHAAPVSLRVATGGASPAGGSVMEPTTVVTRLTSCLHHAVCYYQGFDLSGKQCQNQE